LRFTVDTNVLVYASDTGSPEKRRIAREIMARAMTLDAVLTAQALAEFLNVVRRKNPAGFSAARAQAERWATVFPVASTNWEQVSKAAELAERHRLQFWDCLIWQSARALQTAVFLSEDMQDGFSMDGMTVLNPFAGANAKRLADLLEKADDSV